MASPGASGSAGADDFTVGRWGTFTSPKVESAYLDRRFREGEESRRRRLAGSTLASAVIVAVLLWLLRAHLVEWLLPIALAWLPFTAVHAIDRAGWGRIAVERAWLLLDLVGTSAAVYTFNWLAHLPESGLVFTVVACVFQFGNPLLPPLRVAPAILPFLVLELVAVATRHEAGLDEAVVIGTLTASYLLAMSVATTANAAARRAHAQERVIESQKETILRELSAVLAKSDTALRAGER